MTFTIKNFYNMSDEVVQQMYSHRKYCLPPTYLEKYANHQTIEDNQNT